MTQDNVQDLTAPGPSRQHTALRLITIAFGLFAVSFFINIALARLFSPAEYGNISIGIQALGIGTMLITMGTSTTIMSFFARYVQHRDHTKAQLFRQWQHRIIMRNSALMWVAILTFILIAVWIDPKLSANNLNKLHVAVSFLLMTPITAVITTLSTYLSSRKKVVLAQIINDGLEAILVVCFLVGAFAFIANTIRPYHITSMYLIVFLILAAVNYWIERSKNTQTNQQLPIIKDVSLTKRWHSNCIQSFWAKILQTIATSTSIFVLEFISNIQPNSNEADVGLFAACITMTTVLYVLPLAYNDIYPRITATLKQPQGAEHINAQVKQTTRLIVSMSVLICAMIIVFGGRLLSSFGSEYVSAYPILLIVLIDGVRAALCRYSMNALPLIGCEKQILHISIKLTLLNLFLSLILTYYFSLYGAAISLVLSWSYAGIASLKTLRQHSQLRGLGYL
jgi:O-antigen/teichoic acid export membrane protein